MKTVRYSEFKKQIAQRSEEDGIAIPFIVPAILEPLIIVHCPNFNKAFSLATRQDKEYSYERHVLEPGEEIQEHDHPFSEWIVVNRGHFRMMIGSQEKIFDLRRQRHVNIIYIPKGQKHSLIAIGKISYYVLKDK